MTQPSLFDSPEPVLPDWREWHELEWTNGRRYRWQLDTARTYEHPLEDIDEAPGSWRWRSRAAYKGQLTKAKNRIAKGECPSCRTEFADLAAHMERAHPDYAEVES